MSKSKSAVAEKEAPKEEAPGVGLQTTNPNYQYGLPVTVSGNPANGGSPVVATGEVENGGTNGGSQMVPPANTGTVFYPGGSPNDELVSMYTPTLASISPTTAVHGAADAVVTCTGTGFLAATSTRGGTVARVDGVDQATTYVSATSVTYVGKHSTQAAAGTVSVTVANLGIVSPTPRTFTYT